MVIIRFIVILVCVVSQDTFAESSLVENTEQANQIIEDKCHHCHGYKGEASNVIYPRLAAQDKAYMVKQLTNFKSGARQGTMNEIAKELSESDIVALADYFSQQPSLTHKVRNSDLNAVGKYIFHKGNKYSGVPACASCHGNDGSGTVKLPRLAGQHKRYISSQLEEFNLRKRTNDNVIMHSIATKLTELEREAVALYASGL